MFPSTFDRYIEVFGGAGWVLFAGEKHAPLEIYNDANGDLVNLFRVVKYHAAELQRELSLTLNSREVFSQLRPQLDSPGLTDIQRAAKFFLLIRLSFGSDTRTFGCNMRNMGKMMGFLTVIEQRLNGVKSVVIEHKDFENLIKVCDRPGALFYCDPPYYNTESYYDAKFIDADHLRLRDSLAAIKGRFILSYNDHPYVRELYKDFNITPVLRSNNLSSGQYSELIITNYTAE